MKRAKEIYHKVFKPWYSIVEKEIEECETILDVGCGSDSPLRYFRRRKSTGIDIDKTSITKASHEKIHERYIRANILNIDKIIQKKSFDAVIALDVIEHLKKEDGKKLIKKMEKIAKKKVVLFTPNGFLPQEAYDNNKYQMHRSGWRVSELRSNGYRVIGANGLKWLKTSRGEPKYRPRKLWLFLGDITQIGVKYYPQIAFQLVGVKELT